MASDSGNPPTDGSTATAAETALFQRLCTPILSEIRRRAAVTDHLLDRDVYQVLAATIWANIVSDPPAAGLRESQLEPLHNYLNQAISETMGAEHSLHDCFRFVASPDGEAALARLKVDRAHRNLLFYFASMILDPEGHRDRMADQNVLR